MEFKLKDVDSTDTAENSNANSIWAESDKVYVQDADLGIEDKYVEPASEDVGILAVFGVIMLLVCIASLVVAFVFGADEKSAKNKIAKSYKVMGEVTSAGDIDLNVRQLHKNEEDSVNRYKVEWKQDITIVYEDKNGKEHSYTDKVLIDERVETIGEREPLRRNSVSYVKDKYKKVDVSAPYQKGQKIELYVDENDPKTVYETEVLKERAEGGHMQRNLFTLSFIAFVACVLCFAFDKKSE